MPPLPSWRVFTANSIGAQHVAMGKTNEDSVVARQPSPGVVSMAVADGHGHARHFRSARGSALAVEVATRLGEELAAAVDGAKPAYVERLLREHTGGELVRVWRAAVERDLAAAPVRPDELHAAGLGASPTDEELRFAYGATLLLAVVAGGWLMCVQIGDGDVLAVTDAGRVLRPVPADPRLDGSRTTSLCQADAADALRYGVLGVADTSIAAVMLATDGYGNAQVRNDWDVAFGADLVALAAAHGTEWLGEQLPGWVRRCASSDGSGDDVTVALACADGTDWRPAPAPATLAGDVTTVADVTLPVGGGKPVVDDRTVPNTAAPGRLPSVANDVTMPYGPGSPPVADATVLHRPPDDRTVLRAPEDATTVLNQPFAYAPASPPPPQYAAAPAMPAMPVAPQPSHGTARETILLIALAAVAAVGAVLLVVLLVG